MTATAAGLVASDCTRYQDALIDFVDCGDAGPNVAAALAHLERCEACTRDLAATALVLTALRRMFDEARTADSPADAWPRLRARVTRRQRRSWAPGTISGLVTGAALVTALLLPNAARLDSAVYPIAHEPLEALRMQLPRAANEDLDSLPVHLDRANSVGSAHEVLPPPVQISLVGPWPDNVRPAPVTTTETSHDVDPVNQRALRPI